MILILSINHRLLSSGKFWSTSWLIIVWNDAPRWKKVVLASGTMCSIWPYLRMLHPMLQGSSLGIVVSILSGEILRRAIQSVHLKNKEAEYKAMIAGLELA